MLKEKIREELKDAMRAKDELKVNTLRGAIAAFTNELVAKGKKPTDELSEQEMIGVLKRLAKQRKEAAEMYVSGGRQDLADKEAAELKILEEYLPVAASREEIERAVRAKKAELGVTDAAGIGKLMGAVMKELGGNADGNEVKAVITELLG